MERSVPAGDTEAEGPAQSDPGWRLWLPTYVLCAVVPALTLLLHPLDAPLMAPRGDIAQTAWNFWWFDRAVSTGRNPWECPILFAPFGAKLFLHTFEAVDALLTMPLRLVFAGPGGVFLSWKLAMVLHTFWTAAAFHLLGRALGLGHRACGLGAVAIALCSYRMVTAPTLTLQCTGNALFLAWAVVRCWREPDRMSHGLWLGGASVLLLFSNLYYLFFSALLLAVAGLVGVHVTRPPRSCWAGWARQGGLALAVGILPLAFVVGGIRETEAHLGTVSGYDRWVQVRGSAELAQFLAPVWLREAVTGTPVPERVYREIVAPMRAMSFAPPLVLAALLVVGLRSPGRTRNGRIVRAALGGVLAASFLISLGPDIKVLTRVDPADVPFVKGPTKPPEWQGLSVPSPYAAVAGLPVFRHIRGNHRAGFFFLVAVLLLAGRGVESGLAAVGRWFAARGIRPGLATVLVLGLVVAESRPPIFQVEPERDDEGLVFLRDHGGTGGVREYPDFGYVMQGRAMYHQTIHGRPLLGGYLSRDPVGYDRWIESRPWGIVLRNFSNIGDGELADRDRAAVLATAAEDGLRFIVINTDSMLPQRSQAMLRLFERSHLGRVIYEDRSRSIIELSPPG